MKKYILILFGLLLITTAEGQKPIKNESDKFSMQTVKETSSGTRIFKLDRNLSIAAHSIGSSKVLIVQLGGIRHASRANKLTLLLANEKTVELTCVNSEIRYQGKGAYKLSASCSLSSSDILTLKEIAVKRIRFIYADSNYEDVFKMHGHHKWTIKKELELLD